MFRASKIFSLILLVSLCSRIPAMESDFSSEKKKLLEDGTWFFDYGGQKSVKEIVVAYNGIETIKNHVKIGIDSKLAAMSVTDFKVGAVPVLTGLKTLADKLKAKLYAINDSFVYIATDLPAGFVWPNSNLPKLHAQPAAVPAVAPAPNAPPPVGMTGLPVVFPNTLVGWSTMIPWSHVNYDDCRKDPRPKILFVYDDDPRIETNNTGHFFETLVLEDPECQVALKGAYYVKIGASELNTGWPPNLLEAAKMPESVKTVPRSNKPKEPKDAKDPKDKKDKDVKEPTNPASSNCTRGAALFLLKPDCSPTQIAWYEKSSQITAKMLIDAAKPLLESSKPKTPPPAPDKNKTVADKGNTNDPAKPAAGDTKPPQKPKKAGSDDDKE